jgi:hypothetical protein
MFKHTLVGVLVLLHFFVNAAHAQTVEQVKAQNKLYYWGEGVGKTATLADKEALSMLIGSISVNVESKFSLLKKELSHKSKSVMAEQLNSVINTYSNATIKNTEILTWGDEPKVHVFRFVKKAEVNKIFAEREEKIKEFTRTALHAEGKAQVADALRYCYWALMLLQSHPNGASMKMAVEDEEKNLSVFLPHKINAIFDNLRFEVADRQKDENIVQYFPRITYKNQAATSCEYSFYDGRSWSVTVGAKDGQGVAEMFGNEDQHQTLRVKVEYAFENEWKVDAEVNDVLQKVEPIIFKKSYMDIPLRERQNVAPKKAIAAGSSAFEKVGTVENSSQYLSLLERVERAIRNKNYESVQDCFTPEGYDVFLKLVKYGNGNIVAKPSYTFLRFEEAILVRSLPMRFNFSGNRRVFVEDVVFSISPKEKKIQSLTFGLSKAACADIMQHQQWNEYSRIAIINFIENYQTAYALKRLDYIQSIFSDNALIIVGKVVKHHTAIENKFASPTTIKRTQYTKAQYVKQLGTVFKSNEYVNLKFTDISVKKAGVGGEIYGIQLQQDYFSTTYGDTGYLFLLADLNDTEKPTIHIRTWQPEKDPDFGVFYISNF